MSFQPSRARPASTGKTGHGSETYWQRYPVKGCYPALPARSETAGFADVKSWREAQAGDMSNPLVSLSSQLSSIVAQTAASIVTVHARPRITSSRSGDTAALRSCSCSCACPCACALMTPPSRPGPGRCVRWNCLSYPRDRCRPCWTTRPKRPGCLVSIRCGRICNRSAGSGPSPLGFGRRRCRAWPRCGPG